MKAPTTRGAAIAANCRACVHDPAAPGTWKEQVSVCPATSCPFWRFRPVSDNSPAWIKSRDPGDLPEGWTSLHHDEAIHRLRGVTHDNAGRWPVQGNGGARAPNPMQPPCPTHAMPETHVSDGAQ